MLGDGHSKRSVYSPGRTKGTFGCASIQVPWPIPCPPAHGRPGPDGLHPAAVTNLQNAFAIFFFLGQGSKEEGLHDPRHQNTSCRHFIINTSIVPPRKPPSRSPWHTHDPTANRRQPKRLPVWPCLSTLSLHATPYSCHQVQVAAPIAMLRPLLCRTTSLHRNDINGSNLPLLICSVAAACCSTPPACSQTLIKRSQPPRPPPHERLGTCHSSQQPLV